MTSSSVSLCSVVLWLSWKKRCGELSSFETTIPFTRHLRTECRWRMARYVFHFLLFFVFCLNKCMDKETNLSIHFPETFLAPYKSIHPEKREASHEAEQGKRKVGYELNRLRWNDNEAEDEEIIERAVARREEWKDDAGNIHMCAIRINCQLSFRH